MPSHHVADIEIYGHVMKVILEPYAADVPARVITMATSYLVPSVASILKIGDAGTLGPVKPKDAETPKLGNVRSAKTFQEAVQETLSFFGKWPKELGEMIVDPDDPCPGMFGRIKVLQIHLEDEFSYCSGVYVGKTVNMRGRFNAHRAGKTSNGESILMLALHEFPNEDQALVAERKLTDLILSVGMHMYGDMKSFGGRGKVKGHGRAVVYALFAVRD